MFQTAFFFREKWENHTDMYMNTHMYIYTYRSFTCACTCVSLFLLLCGAVSCRVSHVVVGWVVGCGVVLSTCRCRGGLCPCVVVPLIAWSQKNRKKKKEQERNGAKVAENSLKSVPVSYDEYIASGKSGAFND